MMVVVVIVLVVVNLACMLIRFTALRWLMLAMSRATYFRPDAEQPWHFVEFLPAREHGYLRSGRVTEATSPVEVLTASLSLHFTMGPLKCVVLHSLANVNSRSRSLYAIARPSVVCLSVCRLSVCNVRAPYSGGSNFRQYFYGIWYPSHPLTSTENFTEIVPGEPLRRGS